jgi:hypothetical protein
VTIVCESLPLFATMACRSAATRHRPTVVPSMTCRSDFVPSPPANVSLDVCRLDVPNDRQDVGRKLRRLRLTGHGHGLRG